MPFTFVFPSAAGSTFVPSELPVVTGGNLPADGLLIVMGWAAAPGLQIRKM
jgi:hypothetical protein